MATAKNNTILQTFDPTKPQQNLSNLHQTPTKQLQNPTKPSFEKANGKLKSLLKPTAQQNPNKRLAKPRQIQPKKIKNPDKWQIEIFLEILFENKRQNI